MRLLNGSALPAPSEARLRAFETENGVVLPADYRSFLRRGNAARPVTSAFHDGRRERAILRMLGILEDHRTAGSDGFADIDVVISQIGTRLTADPSAPYASLVPIAELYAGDFVCLDYRRARGNPSIAVWDHERSDDFRPVASPLAAGFTAFAAIVYEPDTGALDGFLARS